MNFFSKQRKHFTLVLVFLLCAYAVSYAETSLLNVVDNIHECYSLEKDSACCCSMDDNNTPINHCSQCCSSPIPQSQQQVQTTLPNNTYRRIIIQTRQIDVPSLSTMVILSVYTLPPMRLYQIMPSLPHIASHISSIVMLT